MTLNTFHFAGHGAANVTLGIPRLREIVLTASAKLKTPLMKAKCLPHVTKERAHNIARHMSRVTLDMIMKEAYVEERLVNLHGVGRMRSYKVNLRFISRNEYETDLSITAEDIQNAIVKRMVKRLVSAINKEMKKSSKSRHADEEQQIGAGIDMAKLGESRHVVKSPNDEDLPASAKDMSREEVKGVVEDDDVDEAEMDATDAMRANKRKQMSSYDKPDEEEKLHIDNGDVSDDDNDTAPAKP